MVAPVDVVSNFLLASWNKLTAPPRVNVAKFSWPASPPVVPRKCNALPSPSWESINLAASDPPWRLISASKLKFPTRVTPTDEVVNFRALSKYNSAAPLRVAWKSVSSFAISCITSPLWLNRTWPLSGWPLSANKIPP